MAERALQISPDPGQMPQVMRLAVAHVQPGKNTEDLARALGGKRGVNLDELRAVEIRLPAAASAHIAPEQRELGLFGNVDACILQQRCDIVGGWPHHRVLKIEQTQSSEPTALRQP